LKPENLFLTEDARVKILDFGVAKLQTPTDDDRSIEKLTTVTKMGAVIGTVAYMSPEQLRSKPVDHRSDIFSLGAILYEMLSGRRAFLGETQVDTITAVLREEPPDANLEQASIPLGYRDVIKHCLEKEPENRFQSAKDLGFTLQTLSGSSPSRSVILPKPQRRISKVLPWAIVGGLAAMLLFAIPQLRPPIPAPTYDRLTFEAGTIYKARFAPDGQTVVYSASWNNRPVQLFSTVGTSRLTQPLNLSDADLLAVSHDNQLALALHGTHNGQLETVGAMLAQSPMAGGSPREMLSDVRWADWDGKGQMAVVHHVNGQSQLEYPIGTLLYQTGGWISDIRFSPKHELIAFMNHPALWDHRGTVCVVDTSGHIETLSREWESEQGLAWRPDGKEIWFTAAERGNNLNLMAVTLSGKVRTLLDMPTEMTLQDVASNGSVLISLNSMRLAMAASAIGSKDDVELSWHDWNVAKDISPDGQFVLFEDGSEAAGAGYAVALRKLDGSLPVRLGEGSPGGLSPDGKWAISISTTHANRVILLPTGAGQSRPIEVSGLQHIQSGWSRFLADGKGIIVNGNEPSHGTRCYRLDLSGGKPRAVTPEGILCGPPSPDGRLLVGMGPKSAVALYPLQSSSPDTAAGRPILGLPAGFHPVRWSTDGSFLFGYNEGQLPSKIFKFSIATGKQTLVQELHPAVPAGVVMVSPVVVSRDGTRFAYSYNQTLSVLYLITGIH
jgi:hypothetical protein